MSAQQVTWAVGRRKESVARVRLMPGTGKIQINGREPLAYFTRETLVNQAERGLVTA